MGDSIEFDIEFDQNNTTGIIRVTITELGDGNFKMTYEQIGFIGDFQDVYLDFDPDEDDGIGSDIPPGFAVTDVTYDDDNDPITEQVSIPFTATVDEEGIAFPGATDQGAVDGLYDVKIAFGDPGVGENKTDIQDVMITSSADDLTLQDFIDVEYAFRLTSVGEVDENGDPIGDRNESVKVVGRPPENTCPIDPDERAEFSEDELIAADLESPIVLENFKLEGATDVDGDDIDVLSLDAGRVVVMIDGVDVSANYSIAISGMMFTLLDADNNELAMFTVDPETGTETILGKDDAFWNGLDDGDYVELQVDYHVTDGDCEDEESTQTLLIRGANDCPIDPDERAEFSEDELIAADLGNEIVLEDFKLEGATDVDGDDIDVLSLDEGRVVVMIDGVDVSANYSIAISGMMFTLLDADNNELAMFTVDPETGTETILGKDDAFWNGLDDGDYVELQVDYHVTDGDCEDEESTQTLLIRGANDCPIDPDERAEFSEEDLIAADLESPIVLEDFKLEGATDVDGDDIDVLSLDAGRVVVMIDGVDVSANYSIAISGMMFTLLDADDNELAMFTVDPETGTETILGKDDAFWNGLDDGDYVELQVDYHVTDGDCEDEESTQTLLIRGANDCPIDPDERAEFSEEDLIAADLGNEIVLEDFKLEGATDVDGDDIDVLSLDEGRVVVMIDGVDVSANYSIAISGMMFTLLDADDNELAMFTVDPETGTETILGKDDAFWNGLDDGDYVELQVDYHVTDGDCEDEESTQTLLIRGANDCPIDPDERAEFSEEDLIAADLESPIVLENFKLEGATDVDGDDIDVLSLDEGRVVVMIDGVDVSANYSIAISGMMFTLLDADNNELAMFTVDPETGTETILGKDDAFWNGLDDGDYVELQVDYHVTDGDCEDEESTQTLLIRGANDCPIDPDERAEFSEEDLIAADLGNEIVLEDFKLEGATDVDGDDIDVLSLDEGRVVVMIDGVDVSANYSIAISGMMFTLLDADNNELAMFTVDPETGTETILGKDDAFWNGLDDGDYVELQVDYHVTDGDCEDEESTQTLLIRGANDCPIDPDERAEFSEEDLIAADLESPIVLEDFKLEGATDVDGDDIDVLSLDEGRVVVMIDGVDVSANYSIAISGMMFTLLDADDNELAMFTVDPETGTETILGKDDAFWNGLDDGDYVELQVDYHVTDGDCEDEESTQTLLIRGANDCPIDPDERAEFSEEDLIAADLGNEIVLEDFKLEGATDVDGDDIDVLSLDEGRVVVMIDGVDVSANYSIAISGMMFTLLDADNNELAMFTVDPETGTETILGKDDAFWNGLDDGDYVELQVDYHVTDGDCEDEESTQTLLIRGANDCPIDPDERAEFSEEDLIAADLGNEIVLEDFKLEGATDVDGDDIDVLSLDEGRVVVMIDGVDVSANYSIAISGMMFTLLDADNNELAMFTVDPETGTETILGKDDAFWNGLDDGDYVELQVDYHVTDGDCEDEESTQTLLIRGANDCPIDPDERAEFSEEDLIAADLGNEIVLEDFKLEGATDVDGDDIDVLSLDEGRVVVMIDGVDVSANYSIAISGMMFTLLDADDNELAMFTVDPETGTETILGKDDAFWNGLDDGDYVELQVDYHVTDGDCEDEESTQTLLIRGANDCPIDPDERAEFSEEDLIAADLESPIVLEDFKLEGATDVDGDDIDVLSLDEGRVVVMIDGVDVSANYSIAISGMMFTLLDADDNELAMFTVDPETGTETILGKDDAFWNGLDDGDYVELQVDYHVTDGDCEDEESTQTLLIRGANDCPIDPDERAEFSEEDLIAADLGNEIVLEDFKLEGATDVDGDDIDVLSLDEGRVVVMIDGVDVSANYSIAISGMMFTLLDADNNELAMFTVDPETGTETILGKDDAFWNGLDDGDYVELQVDYHVTDGDCEDEESTQTLKINGVNDCPTDPDESYIVGENCLVYDDNIFLENFKLNGAMDPDGDDLDILSLDAVKINWDIDGMQGMDGIFSWAKPDDDTILIKYDGMDILQLDVDFETGSETITSLDDAFWKSLNEGDSVDILVDYHITDGTCDDEESTQTISIFGQDSIVFEELSNLVLYIDKDPTEACDIEKIKFNFGEDSGDALMDLVNDGSMLSFDDIDTFMDLYSDYTGLDLELIAFTYKQGQNQEALPLGPGKGKNKGFLHEGEGQLVDLTDNADGLPEGQKWEDGFLSAKEAKQQDSDVSNLGDINSDCLKENNYAILGENYTDGADLIAAILPDQM